MDRIWAPWRSTHVENHSERSEDDFLRRIATEDRDPENLVIYRGDRVFVLLNLYPYNNGHCMIAPCREVAEWTELTPEERHEMADVLGYCMEWIRSALKPDGFNTGLNIGASGGAGFPKHLHMHVVPRWKSDTNFMPVIGQAKVLPESLESSWKKLVAAVRAWESTLHS